jgi:ABC-type lipoprotein export system ATPase subunit
MPFSITPEQIEDFIQLFNGDALAATQAIQSYAQREQIKAKKHAQRQVSEHVVITVKDLIKIYTIGHQTIRALNSVTLDIYQGEFVAIMAPSGSGKSTLLQLMGALEKPTAGSITIDGVDPNRLSDNRLSEFRARTVGFVFQFFYLQPFLTLERNLEVPGMFARTARTVRQARTQELAEIVGIADRLHHYPKELSGGQIQRAAIVRALFNHPKVILADEPTGNLDSKNGAGIIDLFEKIRDEFGTTIVIVTHDQTIAQRADRIIRLRDGSVV